MTLIALVGPTETDDHDYLEAETLLRLAGFHVLNPTKRRLLGATRLTRLRHQVRALCDCDGVATLQGWAMQTDALLQVRLVQGMGLPTMPVSAWLDQGPEEDVNG